MSTSRWVVFEPLDTIVIRDGRDFHAGMHSEAQAVLPSPATVAGAIGAAYGSAPGAGRAASDVRGRDLPEQIRGPFLVCRDGDGWRARWPIPRDVVCPLRGKPFRLRPAFLNEGEHLDLDVPAVLDDGGRRTEPMEGWWDTGTLTDYLRNGTVSERVPGKPWQWERRVGLARAEGRTAAEGMLYMIEHLRFAEGYGLAARCMGGPDRQLPDMVNLGGRGRRAQLHRPAEIALPARVGDFPGGRLLVYLATPAVFPGGGWRPDLRRWPGTELITAATGPAQPVTTATSRRGTISDGLVMWAVPPGSVYYLRFPSEQAAAEAAAHLHEHGLDQAEDWMRTAGFGTAFVGRWA